MNGEPNPSQLPAMPTQQAYADVALKAAGLGIWKIDPITELIHWDNRCRELMGLAGGNAMPYQQALCSVHPDDIGRVDAAIRQALAPTSSTGLDLIFRTIGATDKVLRQIHLIGQRHYEQTGEGYSIAGIAQDLTGISLLSEPATSPINMAERALEGANMGWFSIHLANDHLDYSPRLAQLITGSERGVINRASLISYVHPEDRPLRNEAYERAEKTGKLHYETRFVWDDESIHWVRVKGTYYDDPAGKPYFFYGTAQDITAEVIAQKALRESQRRVLASFEQSPVAIAQISAVDLSFQMVNPFYGQLVGRTPDELVGKPLLEALPELAGQGFDQILTEVITTGNPYVASELAVMVFRGGQFDTLFVNLTYQPQREFGSATDRISGVLVVATDVTQQVLARQKVEEAQSSLQSAIELAQLGTWQIDLATNLIEYSPRLRTWHGLKADEIITPEKANRFVRKTDWPRVREAIAQAILPDSNGFYDVEYVVETSQERILRALGKAHRNEQGQAYKISGTVQDITEQRNAQFALEQQVRWRTEELDGMNEELTAANEELLANNESYVSLNKELEEANELLGRSNKNLEQFAYIASHDLQEPLRKIQAFGDLLTTQYAASLGEGADYLHRIQLAASRMSTLIRDLLSYSRIATQRDRNEPVSLTDILNAVLSDLDLRIQETGAVIDRNLLPMVQGDASQLEQLFHNLLSNALKFSRTDEAGNPVPPLIRITAGLVRFSDLPTAIKPARIANAYHQIDVADNGIGFDDRYIDRIFQVFQRLHGKNEFSGTGVGLAICEKVVTNHGGAITAISQPGQGATFRVYLPL